MKAKKILTSVVGVNTALLSYTNTNDHARSRRAEHWTETDAEAAGHKATQLVSEMWVPVVQLALSPLLLTHPQLTADEQLTHLGKPKFKWEGQRWPSCSLQRYWVIANFGQLILPCKLQCYTCIDYRMAIN